MKRASDMMNAQVVCVHPDDRLEDAVTILTLHNISGLPVVDEEEKVIGIITDRDLLIYSGKLRIIPLIDYSGWIFPYNYIPESIYYEKNAKLFSKTRVEEVMSKRVVTVKENTSLHDIANLMKKNSINRIPVVDSKGRLKGIITRTDLLNHLAEDDDDVTT